jgi:hypothetical protein
MLLPDEIAKSGQAAAPPQNSFATSCRLVDELNEFRQAALSAPFDLTRLGSVGA